MPRPKRQMIVVNPHMQRRFAYFALVVSAVGGTVMILLIALAGMRLELGIPIDGPSLMISGLVTLACQCVLLYRYALRISNRLAGPIYRISRELLRVAEGDFNVSIKLRRHDEWYDFASDVNTFIDRLRDSRADLKKRVERSQLLLADGNRDAALEVLEDVRRQLDDSCPPTMQ